MRLQSQVIITSKFEDTLLYLKSIAKDNQKFVPIIAEKVGFSVDEAKLAIEKAYLASVEETYMVLCAQTFSPVVQNRLLKIIEEPPAKKSFILMTPSKSSILPTIYSRLPVHIIDEKNDDIELPFEIKKMDIKAVYDFVQSNSRTSSSDTRKLIEYLSKEVIKSGAYNIDEKLLQTMSDSVVALDKGSPASFVLTGVLLKMLALKKRKSLERVS